MREERPCVVGLHPKAALPLVCSVTLGMTAFHGLSESGSPVPRERSAMPRWQKHRLRSARHLDTWTHGHQDTWPKRSRMVVGTLCVTTCFISITVSLKEQRAPTATHSPAGSPPASSPAEDTGGTRHWASWSRSDTPTWHHLAHLCSQEAATRPLLEEARPQLRGWAHCQKQCGQACPRMTTRDRPFCGLLGGLQDPGTMVLKYGPQP